MANAVTAAARPARWSRWAACDASVTGLGPGMGRALLHAGSPDAARHHPGLRKTPSERVRASGQAHPMATRLDTGRMHREWRTMQVMVGSYCSEHGHNCSPGQSLCAECAEFLGYAERRLEKCPYGPAKPTCAKCPIHCYKPQPREFARVVMRYAGPRMVLRHPWLSLTHFLDKARRVEHPMAARRSRRDPG